MLVVTHTYEDGCLDPVRRTEDFLRLTRPEEERSLKGPTKSRERTTFDDTGFNTSCVRGTCVQESGQWEGAVPTLVPVSGGEY